MRALPVLFLAAALLAGPLVLAGLAAGGSSHAPPAAPDAAPQALLAVTPGVVASLSATEGANFAANLPLWHNTTTTNASVAHAYPANLTLYPANAPFTARLTVNAGNLLPVVEAYQGATVLLNATVSGQATVSPAASSTPLSVRILQLFTQAGAAVAVGAYHVWVNVSESATLSNTTAVLWSEHLSSYNATYSMAAPYGYWLNASSVFVPFPGGLPVNFTSVKVANASAVQTTFAGVYASNVTLKPGKGLTLSLSLVPVPATTGPATVLALTAPRLIAGSSTEYTAFANFTNPGPLPYAGIYLLEVPSSWSYPIDPASVVVRAGTSAFLTAPGTYHYELRGKNLSAPSYTTEGQNVVIVPGALTVGVGVTESFEVNLSSAIVPPSLSMAASHVVLSFGSVGVTAGSLVEGLMVLPVLYALLAVRLHRGEGSARLRVVMVDVCAAQFALLCLLALSVVF